MTRGRSTALSSGGSAVRRRMRFPALLLAAAAVVSFLAPAPASASESIWNMEGLGRPLYGYDHAARGAGSTAIAGDDPFGMSFVNPASIAHAQMLQAHFGLVTQSRWIQAEGTDGSSRRFDARLTAGRAVLIGPGPFRWALGYTDLTDGAYQVSFPVNAGREDAYERTLEGRGGIGELSATVAAALPGKRAAAGLHLGLANGTLHDIVQDEFTDATYLDTDSRLRTRVEGGMILGVGAQASPVPQLALGGYWRFASEVDLEGIWEVAETAPWSETASFDLPASVGLGVALRPNPRLRLAADWNRTLWGSSDFTLRNLAKGGAGAEAALQEGLGFGLLQDANRLGLGVTFFPPEVEGKVAVRRRLVWRAGFSWEELPVRQSASFARRSRETIHEWMVTAGCGVPIQVDRGFLDIVLEAGRTGSLDAAGARETFLRLGFGATFGRFEREF